MEEDTSEGSRCVRIARLSKLFTKEQIKRIEQLAHVTHELSEKASFLFKAVLLENFIETNNFTHKWATEYAKTIDISKDKFIQYLSVVNDSDVTGENGTSKKGRPFSEKKLTQIKGIYDRFQRWNNSLCNAVNASNIKYITDYVATQFQTSYKNNIFMHYDKYVINCIGIYANQVHIEKYPQLRDVPRKQWDSELRKEFYTTKKVWIKRLLYTDKEEEQKGLPEFLYTLVPEKMLHPQKRAYALKTKPQLFLVYMIYMTRWCEDNNGFLYMACPIRSSFVVSHFTMCTQTLVYQFVDDMEDFMKIFKVNLFLLDLDVDFKKITSRDTLLKNPEQFIKGKAPENLTGLWKRAIWMSVSKIPDDLLSTKTSGEHYEFNNMIMTNGYKASICYCSSSLHGTTSYTKGRKRKVPTITPEEHPYFTDIEQDDREKLTEDCKTSGKVLFADPGKRDLVTIGTGYTNGEKIKYSAAQRKYETGQYRAQQVNKKKLEIAKTQGIDIKNIENSLGVSKSCYLERFLQYVANRNANRQVLMEYYSQYHFRKTRMRALLLNRSSLDKFAHRIKTKFPVATTIVYGNWSSTSLRNQEPTMGKGLRKFLGKHFTIYRLDEYLTSQRCPKNSEHQVNKVEHRGKEVHCVLRCPNVHCKSTTWNRDVLSTINMRIKTRYWLRTSCIHPWFRRENTRTNATVKGITVDVDPSVSTSELRCEQENKGLPELSHS
jgi:hypothetical protein